MLESFQRRRHRVLFSHLDPCLTLCGGGLSDDFLSWGTFLGLFGDLPLSDRSTLHFLVAHGLLFSTALFPMEGCSAVTHSSCLWQYTAHRFVMRSSQDRSYLATDCDGHSFPCDAPGIFALMNSGSMDYSTVALSADSPYFKLKWKRRLLNWAPIMNRHYAATKNTVGKKTDIIGCLHSKKAIKR